MGSKTYHYCPKCGYKKLLRKYDYSHGYYIWKCEHGHATARRLRWRQRYGTKEEDKKPKKPIVPCDCEIKADGRHAEIADFGTVLDQINRAQDPEILRWLLENETGCFRRGMKVLYEGTDIDVVRMRSEDGVGVYIYFREAREQQSRQMSDHCALTSDAAHHVRFRDVSVWSLFRESRRFLVWSKDGDSCPSWRKPLFSGPLGKKKVAAIVEWAAALEKELPDLREAAKSEDKRWRSERAALSKATPNDLEVNGYNGHRQEATIRIRKWLTPEQVKAIGQVIEAKGDIAVIASGQ